MLMRPKIHRIITTEDKKAYRDIDGLVQDCSKSSASAIELLQSYT